MSKAKLPAAANLEHLRAQAKDLLRASRRGEATARARFERFSSAHVVGERPTLSQAQFVLAREYGFESWPRLKACVEAMAPEPGDVETSRAMAVAGPSFMFQKPRHMPHMLSDVRTLEAQNLYDHGSLVGDVDLAAVEARLADPVRLLPMRHAIVFPTAAAMLSTSAPVASTLLADLKADDDRWVLLFRQLNADSEAEARTDPQFPAVGVVAQVLPPENIELLGALSNVAALLDRAPVRHIPVRAVHRVRLDGLVRREPYPLARATLARAQPGTPAVIAALTEELRSVAREAHRPKALGHRLRPELPDPIHRIRDAGELADFVASRLPVSVDLTSEVLDAVPVELRLRQVLELCGSYIPFMRAGGSGVDFG